MIISGFLFAIGAMLALLVVCCIATIASCGKTRPPTMAEILRERRLTRETKS